MKIKTITTGKHKGFSEIPSTTPHFTMTELLANTISDFLIHSYLNFVNSSTRTDPELLLNPNTTTTETEINPSQPSKPLYHLMNKLCTPKIQLKVNKPLAYVIRNPPQLSTYDCKLFLCSVPAKQSHLQMTFCGSVSGKGLANSQRIKIHH